MRSLTTRPTRTVKPVSVSHNGLTLMVYSWENVIEVFAAAEAYLSETDAKPGLGLEVEPGATRFWSGGPACNWSFMGGDAPAEETDQAEVCPSRTADELSFYELARPF